MTLDKTKRVGEGFREVLPPAGRKRPLLLPTVFQYARDECIPNKALPSEHTFLCRTNICALEQQYFPGDSTAFSVSIQQVQGYLAYKKHSPP